MGCTEVALEAERDALRRAVHRADFDDAAASAQRYMAILAALLPHLSANDARDQVRHGVQLLEWARRGLCAERMRLKDELRRVCGLAAYRHEQTENGKHCWTVQG